MGLPSILMWDWASFGAPLAPKDATCCAGGWQQRRGRGSSAHHLWIGWSWRHRPVTWFHSFFLRWPTGYIGFLSLYKHYKQSVTIPIVFFWDMMGIVYNVYRDNRWGCNLLIRSRMLLFGFLLPCSFFWGPWGVDSSTKIWWWSWGYKGDILFDRFDRDWLTQNGFFGAG